MNLKHNAENMKKLGFGVEIEMGCISIENTVKLIAKFYHDKYGTPINTSYDGGYYREWSTRDHLGRKWKGMTDGSASGRLGHISCEMVTPILNYDDIEDLQEIVRILRQNGARSGVDYNAGVHIHVTDNFDQDGGQTAKSIRNLVNIMASHGKILMKAINVSAMREHWCRPVDRHFLERINQLRPTNYRDLGVCWYNSEYLFNDVIADPHGNHYDDTRYQILNLHSMFTNKGIEFRLFEFHRGLHAGELKAWIQLCLAMCSYATIVRYSRPTPVDMSNEKYAMNSWLKNMGLIGEEFKTARKHLLKRLDGDTAYRNGRPSDDQDDIIEVSAYGGMDE